MSKEKFEQYLEWDALIAGIMREAYYLPKAERLEAIEEFFKIWERKQ